MNFMGNSIVKVCNLSHRYSVHWAIREINFEITGNGVVGLLVVAVIVFIVMTFLNI